MLAGYRIRRWNMERLRLENRSPEEYHEDNERDTSTVVYRIRRVRTTGVAHP